MDLENIIFCIVFIGFLILFIINFRKILFNIKLGRKIDRSDNSAARWKNMIRIALGQSKMIRRPVAGIFHIIIYLGFIIINIEMIEILFDGIFGTHRSLLYILPSSLYNLLISVFEILAFLVILACIVFLARRNIMKIKRFWSREMTSWPRNDANLILIFEVFLMFAFLFMNASDLVLQHKGYIDTITGEFLLSIYLTPFINHFSIESLIFLERFCWWFHIIGVLLFMNYILISKHLHIFFAFPSTYYANLKPLGQFNNLESVTNEVKLMLDPNADPYSVSPKTIDTGVFGAKDATDLNWVQLLNSYSCTECGRCTSNCPANQTGKLLSPRKILMDTRKRITEIGRNIRNNNNDNKSLLGDYITSEELWACTSCNACNESCPIDLDPLSIILDMRRFLVMEQSAAPSELNMMFSNIENNGAPWQFSPADRLNWKDEK